MNLYYNYNMIQIILVWKDPKDAISFSYHKACGRTALGGEHSESGPSVSGIGRGIGTRVVAATLAVSERLPIRNSPPF